MSTRSLFLTLTAASLLTTSLMLTNARAAEPVPVAVDGAEVGKWTADLDAAKKLAAERNLPLLLNFTGSDWCHYCKLMNNAVFPEGAWKDFAARRLVLVTLDKPKDASLVPAKYRKRNTALHEEYKAEGVPTYVFLDADGETELGRLGVPSADPNANIFIRQVVGVLRSRPSELAAFIKQMSPEKAAEYRTLLEQHKAARKDLEDWLATRPQRTEANTALFAEKKDTIAAIDARIVAVELAVTLQTFGSDRAKRLQALLDSSEKALELLGDLGSAQGDLSGWLLTRPGNAPADREQLGELRQRVQDQLQKLADLL